MKKLALYLVIIAGILTIGYLAMTPQTVNASESDVITTSSYQPFYRGGMMGYGTGGTAYGCRSTQTTDQSYEWLYLHLSDADQDEVDAKQAELIQAIDFSTLTVEAIIAVQNDIKIQLVEFIEAQAYVLNVRPY